MVFLDANISGRVILDLTDIVYIAHWITAWRPRRFIEAGEDSDFFSCTREQWEKIKKFFDLTGEENVFGGRSTPDKMSDTELLAYIIKLAEARYPRRVRYIFYTCDSRFFKQKSVRESDLMAVFGGGGFIYKILSSPRGDNFGIAREIRHDLEARLGTLCKCPKV